MSNSCGINSTTVKASISRGVTQPCSTPSAPVISIDKTTVLSGDQVALTATNCSYTVNWSDGATGLSRSVNSQNSTTYTATCQNGNCTSEASNSVSITVYIWAGKFSEMQSSRPPCSIQTFQIVYSASGDITPGNTLFVNVSTTLAGGWYLVYTDNEYYTVEVNESGEVMSRRVCSQ